MDAYWKLYGVLSDFKGSPPKWRGHEKTTWVGSNAVYTGYYKVSPPTLYIEAFKAP